MSPLVLLIISHNSVVLLEFPLTPQVSVRAWCSSPVSPGHLFRLPQEDGKSVHIFLPNNSTTWTALRHVFKNSCKSNAIILLLRPINGFSSYSTERPASLEEHLKSCIPLTHPNPLCLSIHQLWPWNSLPQLCPPPHCSHLKGYAPWFLLLKTVPR